MLKVGVSVFVLWPSEKEIEYYLREWDLTQIARDSSLRAAFCV